MGRFRIFRIDINVKVFLQLLAIAITLLGYLGGNASKFPLVSRVLNPNFFFAQQGIEFLEKNKILTPTEPGFAEIANLYREKLEPKEAAQSAEFLKFTLGVGGLKFASGLPAKPFADVEIYIKNNPIIKGELIQLKNDVTILANDRIFFFGNIVFWLGICVSIVLIFMKD